MLKGRDNFEINNIPPLIVFGKHPASHYKKQEESVETCYESLSEIFEDQGWNRFNCPYVLVIIKMISKDDWLGSCGRPFNRGFNGGGGLVYMSSRCLDGNPPWFQSALQHELGHSFGLVHINAYGYDQYKNLSIMSYNKSMRWNGIRPPKTPGVLIPEDLRALAKNKKVFPNFSFDPDSDIPSGYKIRKTAIRLGLNGKIPGQKENQIKVETDSGEANESSVSCIVHNLVVARTSGFSAKRMWHSEKSDTGWVSVKLTFPVSVKLCKAAVHSGHSGKYHIAQEVRIEALTEDGFTEACQEELVSADAYVSFEGQKSDVWRFSFRAGPSKQVVLRGVRFFSSATNEIFCPTYPYMGPIAGK
jgi:hypothetical protein